MAAELVGGALLSGFISVMFERLAPGDVILKFFRGKKDLVELLHKLKIKLMSANKLLSDAEEKQLTSSEVKKWLDELTHVIYRADFLMDKIETKALQRKIKNESSTTRSKIRKYASKLIRKFERSVIDEGNQILERLDDLLGQTSLLGLKDGVPTRPLQRLTAPLVVKDSDAIGRDKDKEEIVKLLLSDDVSGQSLSVIPIVGMGGIGKTTLAQLVYEDSRVQQHFAFKVWVTVSEHFNVFQITKAIFQKVTSPECNIGELRELQRELNKALAGKMFLFVLDDVWNENYGQWDSLKSAFESGAHGSRIIVTTRSKDVALTMNKRVMHELKLVSGEDCWRIFEKHAFDDRAEATAELQKIGREIVKRCKGLPLAVKSLAGLLRSTNSNPEECRKILNSDIWQLQFQKDLKENFVPAVWLSYQFLPPYLKRCFAYLSIFPKDCLFDKKKIIWLWMAEGLLEPEEGKKAEEVGEEYLQVLIGRSFFQYSSHYESNLIMHDIVHDLAMYISGEFSFQFNDSNDLSKLPTKACHLSCSNSWEVSKIMKGLTSQTRSLRTLLSLPYSLPFLEKSLLHDLFLKVGGCLRVLSLSGLQQMTELPDSIGNMKYLRYLDLSRTEIKELPDSICTFYNLQTLLLSECWKLAQLPTRLAVLVNLRHLDIRNTCSLKEMPPQMCNLKNLQTLSDFVLGENGGWRIKELGEFPLLGGRLRISGLEYIVDVKDVLEANLKDKKFLSELILEWGLHYSQQDREVLEALQPHTNLKQLTIRGYRGTIFPDWVGHESFCSMVEVDLRECGNVCMLPPLGQLSSLRRLEIGGLGGVVSIGNEFCDSSSTTTNHPFTSLEYLGFRGMQSWEEWSFGSDRLGQEGGVFPSLKYLKISECKKLIVGLPDCHLPSLKSIEIRECDEMVGVFVCQSRHTNAFPSLQSMSVCICPRLESLLGRQSFPSNLKDLAIGRCKKLWENRMKWGLERLPSLMTLSLDGIEEEVDSFPEQGLLLPTTLTELSIEHFKKLKGLDGRAFQHLTSLQNLKIVNCEKLECLPQEGLPRSLSSLTIFGCPVLEQRCQRGTGEDWLKIQHIPKIEINFSVIC